MKKAVKEGKSASALSHTPHPRRVFSPLLSLFENSFQFPGQRPSKAAGGEFRGGHEAQWQLGGWRVWPRIRGFEFVPAADRLPLCRRRRPKIQHRNVWQHQREAGCCKTKGWCKLFPISTCPSPPQHPLRRRQKVLSVRHSSIRPLIPRWWCKC